MRNEILDKIARDSFRYSDYFPDSPRARLFGGQGARQTIQETLQTWHAAIEPFVSHGTWREYDKDVNGVLDRELGSLSLEQFSRAHVRKLIATMAKQGLSRKRIANVLIPLRRALNEAVSDGYIDHNPVNDIELKSVQTTPRRRHEPDPFRPPEIDAILHALQRWPMVRWMYQFALWTGLRPSEYIALRWSDIDWMAAPQPMVRVQRARVRDRIKMPKSDAGYRDVMLFPPALEALKAMKAHTLLRVAKIDDTIFAHPTTGKAWLSDKAPRESFWTPALRRASVRYRDPYQCRHTYASMMFTAGEPLGWVSKQLGHADTVITARTYVRWIEGFDPSVGSRVMAAWKDANGPHRQP